MAGSAPPRATTRGLPDPAIVASEPRRTPAVLYAMELAKRAYVRDNAGRFAETPGGGGAGVIEAEKPAWSPVMSREDAQHWAKDSVLKTPLTHTSGREAFEGYSYDDPSGHHANAGILAEGFDPTKGGGGGGRGIFGAGIYLGLEELDLQSHRDGSELVDRQAREYAYGGSKESNPTHRAMVDIRNPLRVSSNGLNTDSDVSIALAAERGMTLEQALRSTRTRDMSSALQALGYDSMIVTTPGNFEWASGGDQVIVYDPKNIVVIEDDEYRYRKRQYVRDSSGRFAKVPGSSAPDEMPPANATTGQMKEWSTAVLRANGFPKAIVGVSDYAGDDQPMGFENRMTIKAATNGLAKMGQEFPEVAAEVALVSFGPDNTPGMGETIVVETWEAGDPNRGKAGTGTQGVGFLINTSAMDGSHYDAVLDSENNRKLAEEDLGYSMIPGNVGSVKTRDAWAEATAIHEFGHAVHMVEVSRRLKEPIFDADPDYSVTSHRGDAANAKVLNEMAEDQRLVDYIDNAVQVNIRPPSTYAGTAPQELFAEAFNAIHQPGARTTIEPILTNLVSDVERAVRGGVRA